MAEAPNVAVALLEFGRRMRLAKSNREVAFRAVNETTDVLRFDQAVMWRLDVFSHPMVVSASGLADVSVDSPYQQWLVQVIRHVVPDPFDKPITIALDDLPGPLVEEGEAWCGAHLLLCPLRSIEDVALGGMLFTRNEPFSEQEIAAGQWLAEMVAYAMWARRRDQSKLWRTLKSRALAVFAVVAIASAVALVFVPVQLSALAPAEITPLKPIPITSPIEGVVREVTVVPNQVVKAGELLVRLDDTNIRNRLAVAEKSLDIARADLRRATYKSFSDDAARLELQVLGARVRERDAEVAFLEELLSKSALMAPQGGITIFSDPEEWRGKPVQIGERIMLVADPSLIDATLYLPPEDAIAPTPGAEVSIFLHIDPLNSLKATITRASYEAVPGPDGALAYLVRANLAPGHGFPRVGLRGTARVNAEEVSLGFFLFRKPISYLRRSLGL